LRDSRPALIEVVGQRDSRFGLYTANINANHNVIADLDNWPVQARITDDGRKHLVNERPRGIRMRPIGANTKIMSWLRSDRPHLIGLMIYNDSPGSDEVSLVGKEE
jgi:hypothetical protein